MKADNSIAISHDEMPSPEDPVGWEEPIGSISSSPGNTQTVLHVHLFIAAHRPTQMKPQAQEGYRFTYQDTFSSMALRSRAVRTSLTCTGGVKKIIKKPPRGKLHGI